MPELRWALLVLGVLFLAGLAWREFRRPRQARSTRPEGPGLHPADVADAGRRDFTQLQEPARDRRVRQEPTLEIPVVGRGPQEDIPTMEFPSMHAGDDAPSQADEASASQSRGVEYGKTLSLPIIEPESLASNEPASAPSDAPPLANEPPVMIQAPLDDESSDESAAPSADASRQQRVLVLRVVPQSPDRFGGRILRSAFADSGFVFGAYGIFHVNDTAGRVLASAANLTRPGTFDPDAMDEQYFHGLKIFVVLPGSLPPVQAVDELVAAARRLAGKLGGSLQDDVGRPLTLSGLAQMKADLAGTDTPS